MVFEVPLVLLLHCYCESATIPRAFLVQLKSISCAGASPWESPAPADGQSTPTALPYLGERAVHTYTHSQHSVLTSWSLGQKRTSTSIRACTSESGLEPLDQDGAKLT